MRGGSGEETVKEFVMAHPGWTFLLAYLAIHIINAVFEEIRIMIRGYRPHCHDCEKEASNDD